MSNVEDGRELWSDFDGTAVGTKGKTDPRNWLKYPLPLIDNYPAFLDGVESEGVTIAGVVSRRPNIAPRRKVTELSIAKLGLERHFRNGSVVLAGSEMAKAAHVIRRSREMQVGLIDDKPHKIGMEILQLLDNSDERSDFVTLGAVAHARQGEYIDRLIESADSSNALVIEDLPYSTFYLRIGRSVLKVVEMMPYSAESGEDFARRIGNYSSGSTPAS